MGEEADGAVNWRPPCAEGVQDCTDMQAAAAAITASDHCHEHAPGHLRRTPCAVRRCLI